MIDKLKLNAVFYFVHLVDRAEWFQMPQGFGHTAQIESNSPVYPLPVDALAQDIDKTTGHLGLLPFQVEGGVFHQSDECLSNGSGLPEIRIAGNSVYQVFVGCHVFLDEAVGRLFQTVVDSGLQGVVGAKLGDGLAEFALFDAVQAGGEKIHAAIQDLLAQGFGNPVQNVNLYERHKFSR